MQTVLLTVVVFALVGVLMSVGVIIAGKVLKGSCGGIAVDADGNMSKTPCSYCDVKDQCEKAV